MTTTPAQTSLLAEKHIGQGPTASETKIPYIGMCCAHDRRLQLPAMISAGDTKFTVL